MMVNSERVQVGVRELSKGTPFRFPATGWYFSREEPGGNITFEDGKWTCMFKLLGRVASGEKLCFSAQHTGCRYAAFYLGFEEPGPGEGAFLAAQARVKEKTEYGVGHYATIQAPAAKEDYLVLEQVERIEDGISIEVVSLWVDALSLSGLVTLANYDRRTNDNVVVPYASGCQSIWTIPYKEAFERSPKAVVGSMDPVVRHYLPADLLSFSMPANRFVEMSRNAAESFLDQEPWTALLGSCVEESFVP
jgi:hypothetical protein